MTELPFHRDRPEALVATPLALAEIRRFDDVLDARSPSEFAEDHLPGASNVPVLDDEERALVGTVYKQRSAFEAKRLGAPIAARNIARAIEERFAAKPRDWRPLVYCWRGGGRSGSLAHVLRQVGWSAVRLDGGYKAFRRQVVADLERMPELARFHVICGATGSGKSRLLEALAGAGAQVLDLEALAAHRGSVLGELPDAPQPSQKSFETAIWTALSGFDPTRPVYVESESRKVGNLRVPEQLIERMRASRCLRLEAEPSTRVALLLEDYAHFVDNPDALAEKLRCLAPLHGGARIEGWIAQLGRGDWQALVSDLLASHYDPAYRRSLERNYRDAASAAAIPVTDIRPEAYRALAKALVERHGG
ncbi:MAG TPA: tRNA 2-selenouridine(34) synthase MnmH [Usitatibacter sp.]|nr:tRNA 2-selenouridine(34) synthase MnmH [Usitatibacter sp.]